MEIAPHSVVGPIFCRSAVRRKGTSIVSQSVSLGSLLLRRVGNLSAVFPLLISPQSESPSLPHCLIMERKPESMHVRGNEEKAVGGH